MRASNLYGGKLRMKMVSLKRSKAEKKKDSKPTAINDDYGYSYRLDLDGDALEKLGLDLSKLKVDQKFTFTGKAFVKSINSSRGTDYDSDRLCLQMTDIAVEPSTNGGLADAVSAGIDEAAEE